MGNAGINIKIYDLAKPEDFLFFKSIEKSFLNLLSLCFQDKYFGNEVYHEKINKQNLMLLLAYSGKHLVGTLIIKDNEKISGVAVLQNYRRKNIASDLIIKAQNSIHYLYAEIATTSIHMQKLFKNLNFNFLNNKEKILHLLEKQNDRITFWGVDKRYASYVHTTDKYNIDRQKVFIIMDYDNSIRNTI